jgi:hypothetical protein
MLVEKERESYTEKQNNKQNKQSPHFSFELTKEMWPKINYFMHA